jgi:predicted acyltransferase
MSLVRPTSNRIASLDQFRGYTVAGMFLVNFLGAYAATPLLLKHHNTFCSYADTIMPQFLFAVGFAFRLTFGRRAHTQGLAAAYGHVVKRLLGLALIAMVVYQAPTVARTWSQLTEHGPWEAVRMALGSSVKTWFQTLMHIAVTSLWILPVIRAGALVRIAYMVASALAHVALSHWFYYDWVQTGGIDGGVLGFLTWTIPTILGTLACDAVTNADGRPWLAKMFAWSAVLMAGGWLMSCGTTLYNVDEADADDVAQQLEESEGKKRWAADPVVPSDERRQEHALAWAEPPFVPAPAPVERLENYWMMSQRAGTVSYQTFAAGLSLALYAVFYIACDMWSWQLGMFRTFGTNALVGYVLHGMVDGAVSPFVPRDSPGWYVTAGFLVFFGITYLFVRKLEKDGIYLKL